MRRFWKQPPEDDVERLLRANRAEPRDEFVASQVKRLEAGRGRARPQRLGRRVLVATVVTALAVGAGVAAGGVHVAGTSVSNLVRVGNSGIHGYGDKGDKGKKGKGHHHHGGPGDHQYVVAVCIHQNSRFHPWIERDGPPFWAAFVVRHIPLSYIVGQDGNPGTCPP